MDFIKKLYNVKLLSIVIFSAVICAAVINVHENLSVDKTKLSDKVEKSKGFQRWITNLKNKGLEINADEFRLLEDVEIYNTKWIRVYSLEDAIVSKTLFDDIEKFRDFKKGVVLSLDERAYVDFRMIEKGNFKENEVRYFGARDDKIIDARVLDCSIVSNCYFDRAWFFSNDFFVVSEFSLNNSENTDEIVPVCSPDAVCDYSFKLHVIDLINNKRLIYVSKPFEAIYSKLMPEL